MARPRSSSARTKMVTAATELLLDAGLPGFSIDEVARRSGVAKTTIYRHFPSRNELAVAALDAAIIVPESPDTGALRDDLLVFLESVRPIFADQALRALFYDFWSAGVRDSELQQLQAEMLGGRAGPTFAIYRNGIDRGEISPDIDYPTALEIIEGPFIMRSISRPGNLAKLTPPQLATLVDRILLQLTPDPHP